MNDDTRTGSQLISTLVRSQESGGVWRVSDRNPAMITVALLRCDAGRSKPLSTALQDWSIDPIVGGGRLGLDCRHALERQCPIAAGRAQPRKHGRRLAGRQAPISLRPPGYLADPRHQLVGRE